VAVIKKKSICIIPARGGSKGIPGKNIKDFLGHPLIAWSIIQARKSNVFQRVIVSTDDEHIARVAVKYGAEVPFLRPESIALDFSSTEEVLDHFVTWLYSSDAELPEQIVLLQPTSPVRNKKLIAGAVEDFLRSNSDSLLAVIESSIFLWRNESAPTPLYDFQDRPRRQDIPSADKVYRETGSLYIFTPSGFLKNKNRLHGRISFFVCDASDGVDIDELSDWVAAEALYKKILESPREGDYFKPCELEGC
jgi:N-acylneuraminate cytidylyltransferase